MRKMDVSDLIVRLLTDGVFHGEYDGSVSSLNELLRPIQYEAVKWPDGSCIVLKDVFESHPPNPRANEIEEVFTRIVHNTHVSGEILDMLIREKWVEDVNGRPQLAKRTLVQHKEFISGLNGRYKICDICGFLSEGEDMHSFCRLTLMEKGKSMAANS